MPRLFFTNLQFEQQIAGDRQNLPVALQQRAAEQACGWLAVAEPGDAIWCPQPVTADYWQRMAALGLPLVSGVDCTSGLRDAFELVPWGWSEAVLRWAKSVRIRCDGPPTDAVRACNSRCFSLNLEQRWSVGVDGVAIVRSPADLQRALNSVAVDQRWVLKAEFGAAARQRLICTGREPDAHSAGWIRKRLGLGETLIFEPWVARVAEAGLQWTIPRKGTPVLEGVTELLSDSSGQYVGNRFGLTAADVEIWRPAIDVAREAVLEIQRTGYFGPVGIDAMRYRAADGTERMRSLQDINARWTMGRLALGWQRVMPSGVWRHGTPGEFEKRQQTHPQIVRTSPATIGGGPVQTATWLEPVV